MKKKTIAIAAMSLMLPVSVYSQGNEALSFVAADLNPITMSMGGTRVTEISSVAYSAFSNPAAVPYSQKKSDAGAGYTAWQPDALRSDIAHVAGACNIGSGIAVMAGFMYGMNGKYDIIDYRGNKTGTFSPSDICASAGVAWRFLPFLSAGINLKYASSRLAEGTSYGAFASDVFLMSKITCFEISAGVSNVGTKVKSLSGDSFSIPSAAVAGFGYEDSFAEKHCLSASVEGSWYFSGALSASAGASYTWNDMVSVRAGYRYGGKSVVPSFASVGAGVRLWGIHMDAAYIIASGKSPLKNTFSVGLGFSF